MDDLLLWLIAIPMVFLISYIIKWSVNIKNAAGLSILLFILSMMLAMFAGAAIYFTYRSLAALEEAAILNLLVMTGGLVGVFGVFLLGGSMRNSVSHLPIFREVTIALVFLNELFMGWTFYLLSGGSSTSAIVSVINSYWFTIPMGAEMLLTLSFLRDRVGSRVSPILLADGALMLSVPTALQAWGLGSAGVYAGSAFMTLLFIYLYDMLYKTRRIHRTLLAYIMALLAVYSLMMVAIYLWALYSTTTVMAISIVAEMLLFFQAIYFPLEQGTKTDWLSGKWRAFALLTGVFIAEFFMGAGLDVVYYGRVFITSIPFALSGGGFPVQVGKVMYDAVVYISSITLSTWFLVMMGVEMGALVLFRIRSVHSMETKIRLSLVIVAYAIYTVLFPYFILPPSRLPYVPFVGWNMGIGTAGAMAPAFLLAILLTYVISGILSLLFGGRQVCSLFCSAALMYQGTFYDSLKQFNKQSSAARKLTTNRPHRLHFLISSLIWGSMVAVAVLSYLDSTKGANLTVFGTDPAYFAYSFYFGVLWYATFIAMPFLGTYACATSGWCHWGSFNQLIGRLGFWKLKVRDPYECVNCKTKACASACPVGLTAMPGSFISRGEFRSYRCIGVGDCVEACPVDNIFFHDVRSVLSRQRAEHGIIPVRGEGK